MRRLCRGHTCAGNSVGRCEERGLDRRLRRAGSGARRVRRLPAFDRLRALPAVRLSCAFPRSVHELFWALILIQVAGLSALTRDPRDCHSIHGDHCEGLRRDRRGGGTRRQSACCRPGPARSPLRLCPRSGTGARFQELHALPPRMRAAIDPRAWVHRPADDGVQPGILFQAGSLCRGRRLLDGVLRPDRDTQVVGATLRPCPLLFIGSMRPARDGRGRLGRRQSCPVSYARHRACARFAGADPRGRRDLDLPRRLVLRHRGPADRSGRRRDAGAVAARSGRHGHPRAASCSRSSARRFAGRFGQPLGRVVLVVVRSTPEYMLAYVLLQLLGPSMLPAIIALAFHNGGIVAYLMGRCADTLSYRPDAPAGLNLYAYETVAEFVPPVAAETAGAMISSEGERPSGFGGPDPDTKLGPRAAADLRVVTPRRSRLGN